MPPQTTKSLRHGQATSLFSPQRGFPLPPSVGQPGRTNVGHIPIITDACNQRGSKSSAVRQRVTCHEVDQKKKKGKEMRKSRCSFQRGKTKKKKHGGARKGLPMHKSCKVFRRTAAESKRKGSCRLLLWRSMYALKSLRLWRRVGGRGGGGRGEVVRTGRHRIQNRISVHFRNSSCSTTGSIQEWERVHGLTKERGRGKRRNKQTCGISRRRQS
mgnify:FL=1